MMPVCMKKKAILKITVILKAQVQTVYVDVGFSVCATVMCNFAVY